MNPLPATPPLPTQSFRELLKENVRTPEEHEDFMVRIWQVGEKILGHGSFGVIHVAKDNHVAKLPNKRNDEAIPALLQEIEMDYLIKEMKVPNVIHLSAFSIVKEETNLPEIIMISPFLGADLFTKFFEDREESIPLIWSICRQLASALVVFAKHGYVHKDLKLENICLDAQGKATIIDCGCMQKISDFSFNSKDILTVHALERVLCLPCGEEVDCWSLGVCVTEMIWRKRYVDIPDMENYAYKAPFLYLKSVENRNGYIPQELIQSSPLRDHFFSRDKNGVYYSKHSDYQSVPLLSCHEEFRMRFRTVLPTDKVLYRQLKTLSLRLLEFNPQTRLKAAEVLDLMAQWEKPPSTLANEEKFFAI